MYSLICRDTRAPPSEIMMSGRSCSLSCGESVERVTSTAHGLPRRCRLEMVSAITATLGSAAMLAMASLRRLSGAMKPATTSTLAAATLSARRAIVALSGIPSGLTMRMMRVGVPLDADFAPRGGESLTFMCTGPSGRPVATHMASLISRLAIQSSSSSGLLPPSMS